LPHRERHTIGRVGWLRAAVLGANDGIVSTASLVIGVAAARATQGEVVTAGVAGLVAGAMSMAAGEYVSVSSQADSERAEIARERRELEHQPEPERRELTEIYIGRGLDRSLAEQVAVQLMAHDALEAHKRDELGITETLRARPLQAAVASAGTFAIGAGLPLLIAMLVQLEHVVAIVSGASLVSLSLLGALAARAGGASPGVGAARVVSWGALAMAITAAAGHLFGVAA
jgi:VIT1/CCC1 family predicted Fe2+/Mn2+ transporter